MGGSIAQSYPSLFAAGERGQLGGILFSSTQEVRPEDVHVSLDDVRGMEEAKKVLLIVESKQSLWGCGWTKVAHATLNNSYKLTLIISVAIAPSTMF